MGAMVLGAGGAGKALAYGLSERGARVIIADRDVDICDAMIGFCLCLCSADGRLSLKERSFIKKLMK